VPPKEIRKQEKNILTQDQETKLFNNLNSPIRFNEGGAAILQALNMVLVQSFMNFQLVHKSLKKISRMVPKLLGRR
jgi:hypothetical protein